jgi:hypothetical protein
MTLLERIIASVSSTFAIPANIATMLNLIVTIKLLRPPKEHSNSSETSKHDVNVETIAMLSEQKYKITDLRRSNKYLRYSIICLCSTLFLVTTGSLIFTMWFSVQRQALGEFITHTSDATPSYTLILEFGFPYDYHVIPVLSNGNSREINGVMVYAVSDNFIVRAIDGTVIENVNCVFIQRNTEITRNYLLVDYITDSGEIGWGRLFLK